MNIFMTGFCAFEGDQFESLMRNLIFDGVVNVGGDLCCGINLLIFHPGISGREIIF